MDTLRIVLLGIAFAGSLAVHAFLDISLGFAFLIFFVGWPVVGTLVTIDDDLPGGWSNPDGSVRPPWLEAPFWEQLIAGVALSSAGVAIDKGWNPQGSMLFWLLAVVGFTVAVAMVRKGFTRRDG
jgi:hypothetical protein